MEINKSSDTVKSKISRKSNGALTEMGSDRTTLHQHLLLTEQFFQMFISAHIHCGSVSVSLYNITTFTPIQGCVIVLPSSCFDDGRAGASRATLLDVWHSHLGISLWQRKERLFLVCLKNQKLKEGFPYHKNVIIEEIIMEGVSCFSTEHRYHPACPGGSGKEPDTEGAHRWQKRARTDCLHNQGACQRVYVIREKNKDC